MKAYLAGSIFYHGDELRNREWAAKIRAAVPNIDLYSPIENTDINGAEGKKKSAGSVQIVDADNARLRNTDVLIACIDGDVLPSGTCAEIGYMSALIENGASKYIIGICTDNRQCYLTHSREKDRAGATALGEQQYSYQNLYVTGLINKFGILVSNIDDAIKALQIYVGWRIVNDGDKEFNEYMNIRKERLNFSWRDYMREHPSAAEDVPEAHYEGTGDDNG